jgi:hypothetical protein
VVHAEVARGKIRVINSVGGRTAAEIDPTNIGGINSFADHRAVVHVTAPIHPAEVRAVSVFVGGRGQSSWRRWQLRIDG